MRIVNLVNQESLEFLKRFLSQNSFRIFELDEHDIKDAQSFFIRSVSLFPQDPPLSGRVNWDAFLDSLRGGLDQLGEKRVAFVWTDAEKMLEHGLADLLIAVGCFEQLAADVATSEDGISKAVELLVFLVGKGDNFRPFGKGAI